MSSYKKKSSLSSYHHSSSKPSSSSSTNPPASAASSRRSSGSRAGPRSVPSSARGNLGRTSRSVRFEPGSMPQSSLLSQMPYTEHRGGSGSRSGRSGSRNTASSSKQTSSGSRHRASAARRSVSDSESSDSSGSDTPLPPQRGFPGMPRSKPIPIEQRPQPKELEIMVEPSTLPDDGLTPEQRALFGPDFIPINVLAAMRPKPMARSPPKPKRTPPPPWWY